MTAPPKRNNMAKLPKFLLTISLTAFAAGIFTCFSSVNWHPAWFVALPTGAIFFGLFLIAYVLQHEAARFDEEADAQRELAARSEAVHTARPAPARLGLAVPADRAVE